MLSAALQLDVRLCSREENIRRALQLAEPAVEGGAEIVVLPELFLTGFCYRKGASDRPPYPSLGPLRDFVEEHRCMLIGSLIDGRLNLGFCLEPGHIGFQPKVHPFGPEKRYFDGGDRISPLETAWGKVGLEICYDIRFPEVARKLTLDGADYLVTIAQFPSQRRDQWRYLCLARAVENQIPHIACNCPGPEFCGSSMIVDSAGGILTEAGSDEGFILGEIDLGHRDRTREMIPCLEDRRPKLY